MSKHKQKDPLPNNGNGDEKELPEPVANFMEGLALGQQAIEVSAELLATAATMLQYDISRPPDLYNRILDSLQTAYNACKVCMEHDADAGEFVAKLHSQNLVG